MNLKYQELKTKVSKIADLNFAEAVLSWDQQTYMPKNGAEFRSQQMSTLKALAHELFVAKDMGKLLSDLSEDQTLTENEKANCLLLKRDYDKKTRYPESFVQEFSKLCGDAFAAWASARKNNKFTEFEPFLTKIVEFKKQEAEFLGYDDHPYEALMDDFETGLTIKKTDEVFTDVKEQLFPFIQKIIAAKKEKSTLLTQKFPIDQQWNVSKSLITQMGYSFDSGRADTAPHPFCTTFAPGDVRITTRADDHYLPMLVFAAIHEAGHALYELGLPQSEHYGLPLGQALSMAFHESQSRLWENNIGRSLPYWKANFAKLQQQFPEQFKGVTVEQFYSATNQVAPSLIRVEADELTYHAHIYIRYLIEKALIEGQINVKDVPSFWNAKYKEYLGITPPTDSEGCLQDVHWCYGAFGYFPTYSLGSFYSAQLMAQMKKDTPDLTAQIEQGNMKPALTWLREKVHVHGRKYSSGELLTRVTGSDLQFSYFMDYAKQKYGALYSV